MANEEQRKAFASYMGAGATSNEQNGGTGSPTNPYLYNVTIPVVITPFAVTGLGQEQLTDRQQFAGLGAPPAAPTPPPAAPSSLASYPGYPGVFPQAGFPQAGFGQAGFPQAGFPQGGFGQAAFPQRPPPLGSPQMAQPQQTSGGYVLTPSEFIAQGTPMPRHSDAGHGYRDHMTEVNRRPNGAPAGTMVPASQGVSRDFFEPRLSDTNPYYPYHQYGQPQEQPMPAPTLPAEEVPVPVMLCHTCSHCGRLRSSGFHRNNPVLPGKQLVASMCRKCKKSMKGRRASSFTRYRSHAADEPRDWPNESIRVEVDHSERRGRERGRTETYRSHYSPSPVRYVRHSSSHTRFGLRGLQQHRREYETSTRVRVSSLSPRRSSRYNGVWPPPDVVPMRPSRSEEIPYMPPGPSSGRTSRPGEVWPPPDVVRTHSYRKVERDVPIRRSSSRIVELSPSPPRARTRVTRVEVESEQRPRRSASVSPVRVRISSRERGRRDEAEARISSHPRAYRQVVPEHRTEPRESDVTSSPHEGSSRQHRESDNGIYETSRRRRASPYENLEGVHVEVGGPRVQFASDRRDEEAAPERRARARYADDGRAYDRDYEHYRDYRRHRRADDAPPEPLVEEFERIRIRRSSPSPRREHEEEVRIDRARRISPSPPPKRYEEEVRVRYVSPAAPRTRTARRPSSPLSPSERATYSRIEYVSRARSPRSRAFRQPDRRSTVEDVTDSDSGTSDGFMELRTWKGIDENGQPATFIEERTTRMLDRGHSGLAMRSWRDV
ncbi:hypothetical protein IQ07DRAFT_685196 [Pyrenochaeta sp. DS3sAY3a]|nr:hypothetical protein IQ07DRAFT_685196 [Pyrenochaeta sp. DS3sAY3a]